MAKGEHYALRFDAMESTISAFFCDKSDYLFTFEKETEYKHCIKIWKEKDGVKSKKPAIINVYNKQGRYCLHVEGATALTAIANECRQFLIDSLSLPDMDLKCFTLRLVDTELYQLFLEDIAEDYTLSDEKSESGKYTRRVVSDNSHASVTLTFYDNGTLTMQGVFTVLFSSLIACATRELSDEDENHINELISLAPQKNSVFNTDIDKLVNNPKPLLDNKLEVFVVSSALLANSNIVLGDYGCYSFGVLKAIEGLLAVKLSAHFKKDTDNVGQFFVENSASKKYRLHSDINDFDNQPELKKYIENAYDTYNKSRNTTFHVRKLHVEASRKLSYEEALGIIEDGLEIINGLCDNW